MTIDEIKELVQIVRDTGIAELEVRRNENSVRIRAAIGHTQEVILPAGWAAQGGPAGAPNPVSNVAASAPTKQDESRDIVVKSPIVGTYYDSASPGAPPFVKVGDQVELKQVMCIIESMKLMNEIEAEVAGVVVQKHVENSRPVEYGESLFTIRPHERRTGPNTEPQ
jgi:acetyl-CoA carboxylase biotin carboxyl carrier protein